MDKNILYEHIWENSQLICLHINADGIISQANKRACTTLGESIISQPFKSILVDFENSFSLENNAKFLAEKHLLSIVTESGMPESFHFNFYLTNANYIAFGEPNNQENDLMNLTLLDLNEELNTLTRKLHKSNAELRKLNKLKNNLLGIAAHDLRNPMGNIKNFMGILIEQLEGDISNDHLRILQLLKKSASFSLHLLDELLDLSAIESGRLNLNFGKYNLVKLIEQFIGINTILASKKNITITKVCKDENIEVELDEIKIEQVINNLLSNAIKFSHQDTNIAIKLVPQKKDVLISVTDEGQGIPEKEVQSIFKPFAKTSVKSTANEKTTGLGLAIVWKIIEGHNGELWLDSVVGKGTTFFFTLPYKQDLSNKHKLNHYEQLNNL